ncbi:MAG: FG-GAP repeat protein [Deltaproteobacteria bacterium]|nr:FG-GAP repeat protein [Deltaproteobacteria bacterium]
MPRLRPLLAALTCLVLSGPPAAAAGAGALGLAAEELAGPLCEAAPPDRIAFQVSAPGAEGLAEPFAAALSGAIARRGFAAVPLRGREPPEQAARAAGADRLARVRLALARGGRELALAAEVTDLRQSFFLQHAPASAARLLTALVPSDGVVRALAQGAAPHLSVLSLVQLFDLPDRVLALAVLEAGDGASLLAATPRGLSLLTLGGQLLSSHPPPPEGRGPVREPWAALCTGDFGGGRIAWQLATMAEAEVLTARGGRLQAVARLAAVPLAAGGAGALYGAFAPDLPVLLDQVGAGTTALPPPRSGRFLLGAAAAPRAGRAAFALLRADDSAEILDAALAPAAAPVHGAGAALALADLDGDGEPELVTSSAEPGAGDRVRALRLRPAETLFASPPVPGAVLAAAAGDLTGDGVDDVVLAAVQPSGESRLWLLTSDPREAGR